MKQTEKSAETVNKIMQSVCVIMAEKGYERMTMQDVVTATGLSKGAIYHHFKSKEEILEKMFQQDLNTDEVQSFLLNGENPQAVTAKKMLQNLFKYLVFDEEKLKHDFITTDVLKNPRFFALSYNQALTDTSDFLTGIIEKGNADKSLCVKYPHEAAQMLLVLSNFWLSPFLNKGEAQEVYNRFEYYVDALTHIGLDIFDDDLISTAKKSFKNIEYLLQQNNLGEHNGN